MNSESDPDPMNTEQSDTDRPGVVGEIKHDLDTLEQAFMAATRRWWNSHIANSPVAKNTAAYNHLQDVLPRLGAQIKKELGS